MIKAIDTFYKGYKFRSRLEARWAVFFDAMLFKWRYEPEGYILEDGTPYLPDFLLTHREIGGDDLYAEVKPTFFTEEEKHKVELFSKENHIILLVGEPEPDPYEILGYSKLITYAYFIIDRKWIPKLKGACDAAKSARFEFGESG